MREEEPPDSGFGARVTTHVKVGFKVQGFGLHLLAQRRDAELDQVQHLPRDCAVSSAAGAASSGAGAPGGDSQHAEEVQLRRGPPHKLSRGARQRSKPVS